MSLLEEAPIPVLFAGLDVDTSWEVVVAGVVVDVDAKVDNLVVVLGVVVAVDVALLVVVVVLLVVVAVVVLRVKVVIRVEERVGMVKGWAVVESWPNRIIPWIWSITSIGDLVARLGMLILEARVIEC